MFHSDEPISGRTRPAEGERHTERDRLSHETIRDGGGERTCGQGRLTGGEVGGRLQTNRLKKALWYGNGDCKEQI